MATYYYAVVQSGDAHYSLAREDKAVLDDVVKGITEKKLLYNPSVVHQGERAVPPHVSFHRFEKLALKNALMAATREDRFDRETFENSLDDGLKSHS